MATEPTKIPLFRIDYDGQWFHDGAPIRRHELARLFAAKGLRIDPEGGYWLQSPESRYPVAVEDVPFIIVDYDISTPGPEQVITLRTNMDEHIVLGIDSALELRPEPRGGMVVPYVNVRSGLYARLNRAVYYKLVAAGREEHGKITIRSAGKDHLLGSTT